MPTHPYLQFFTRDYQAEPTLRLCSLAARGLWVEMLCHMSQNARRGYLEFASKPMTPSQLARMTGCDVDEVSLHLRELENAGVFSRSCDGTIFNRRMVRDAQDRAKGTKRVQEYRKRKECNADVTPPVTTPNGDGVGNGVPVLEVDSSLPEFDGQVAFDEFCQLYPRSNRGSQAQIAFFQSVERVVRERNLTREEAFFWLCRRTKLYIKLTPTKLQQGMLRYLDERTFEQNEEVWRASGESDRGGEKLNQRTDAGRKALQILRATDVVDGNVRPQLERGKDR